jgi:hypothetical protein
MLQLHIVYYGVPAGCQVLLVLECGEMVTVTTNVYFLNAQSSILCKYYFILTQLWRRATRIIQVGKGGWISNGGGITSSG